MICPHCKKEILSYRDRIIKLLEKPMTQTEINKKLNTSFGTIAFNIKTLLNEDIIEMVSKDKKRRGCPTKYKLLSSPKASKENQDG